MRYAPVKTIHHLLPKSRGGSNLPVNVRRVNDNFHRAFHRVFENRSPIEQIAMIANLNSPCLTMDFCEKVNTLLMD